MSLKDKLRSYFKSNYDFLTKFYPGIKFDYLYECFESYIKAHPNLIDPINYFTKKLSTTYPLEYITNKRYFYAHEFYVDERTLIPRFETEILVELALKEINKKINSGKKTPLQILDMGTGSGIIALTLLMESKHEIEIMASDISEDALRVAQSNFKGCKDHMGHPSSSIDFIKSDRTQNIGQNFFDIIVTNPPYLVEEKKYSEVHPQVIKFEPHLALFLKDKEYENWFKELFTQSYEKLNSNGVLLMEGIEEKLACLGRIATECGFDKPTLLEDLTGSKRFLKLSKK